MFKKKPGDEEEDEVFGRRIPKRKQKTQINDQPKQEVPKFDEEYYNKLIEEELKKQKEERSKENPSFER